MTYNDNNDKWATTGTANAGLALGIIGTTLASGVLSGNGIGGGLFGGGNNAQQQQINALMNENAILKSEASTDSKLVSVFTELRRIDKEADGKIANLDKRVAELEVSAPLREQIVLGQVNSVAQNLASNVSALNTAISNSNSSLNASLASNTAALQCEINCIQKTLSGITATYVPASQVTPEPMPLKNSWTQPTATTA